MPLYQYHGATRTYQELRSLLPQVSLPARPTPEALASLGVSVVPDPEPNAATLLAEAQAVRLEALNTAFERAQRGGHFGSSLGFEVDANERANRDVQGLITLMEASGAAEASFCDYGNVMRRVTLDQLKTLRLEIIVYGQALYARKWTLREAIESADTVEAVHALEIEFDTLPAPTLPGEAG